MINVSYNIILLYYLCGQKLHYSISLDGDVF